MRILENIDLHVEEGETIAILGPNGSGKTTLLRTIFGLANLFEGKIHFKETEINGRRPNEIASMGIGYSPQEYNIFPNFTVEENLRIGAFLRSDGKVGGDMEDVFKLFPEIERRRNNLAKVLSGGERQMLAVARALMLAPKLLLLDEPTAGLAPIAANRLTAKIREIAERGITIILVEQNAKIALSISNRAYILVSGRIVDHDSASNLLERKDLEQIYFRGAKQA